MAVPQQEGLVDAWSDENLHPGDEWPREIRNALDRADIAILIVSTNFLTSRFIEEKDIEPKVVRAALTDSSLLFLGFKMHHWNFRVLFRTLLAQEGAKRCKRHMHVAVQVDPDDDQVMDPERARSYLEDYFSEFTDADINVYWGSAQDFLLELRRRWENFEG